MFAELYDRDEAYGALAPDVDWDLVVTLPDGHRQVHRVGSWESAVQVLAVILEDAVAAGHLNITGSDIENLIDGLFEGSLDEPVRGEAGEARFVIRFAEDED